MSGWRDLQRSDQQRVTAAIAFALVLVAFAYFIACPAGLLPVDHYNSSSSATHLTFSCLLQITMPVVVFGLGLLWLLAMSAGLALTSAALSPPYKPPQ